MLEEIEFYASWRKQRRNMQFSNSILRRTRRALAAFVLATVLAPGGISCKLATRFLTNRRIGNHEFGKGLIELSTELGKMYTTEGQALPEASAIAKASLQKWMEMYLRYYTDPPSQFTSQGLFKERMDSVAGPLKRLVGFVASGSDRAGHEQLEALQATFTEFVGVPPLPDPHFLGSIRHGLNTLAQVRGEGALEATERQARLKILQERFAAWSKGCIAGCKAAPGPNQFSLELSAFETALQEESPAKRELAFARLNQTLPALGQAWEKRTDTSKTKGSK